MRYAKLTDAGLEVVSGLEQLEMLDLSQVPVDGGDTATTGMTATNLTTVAYPTWSQRTRATLGSGGDGDTAIEL